VASRRFSHLIGVVVPVQLQTLENPRQYDCGEVRRHDVVTGKMANDRPSQQTRFETGVAVVVRDAAVNQTKD
jgi:hypothetical protein